MAETRPRIRDPRERIRALIASEGLKPLARRTAPQITYAALRLYADGQRPGWKVGTAVAGLLGLQPETVMAYHRDEEAYTPQGKPLAAGSAA